MGLPIHIALVSYGVNISPQEITTVASALSKQAQRDFGPIWNTSATVDAFVNLEDIPIDYWPIIITTNVQGADGYHENKNGQPFSIVDSQKGIWSVTASHELLEMLADPFGRRTRAGNIPDQVIYLGYPPKRVLYLVEVCDPCEGELYSYEINSIRVSDFYTPAFFDPLKVAGVRYSFTGAIDAPRKILDGGYISWVDIDLNNVFQFRMFPDVFSNRPHVLNLSTATAFGNVSNTTNLRSAIDRMTRPFTYRESMGKTQNLIQPENDFKRNFLQQQEVRANDLRNQIVELVNKAASDSKGY